MKHVFRISMFVHRIRAIFHKCLTKIGYTPKRFIKGLVALIIVPTVLFAALVVFTPLPAELQDTDRLGPSVRVLDRNGHLLSEVRAKDGVRARWIELREVGDTFLSALIAAEDARFYYHPGFDPIAIVRATGQNIMNTKIVSGASTLTQQLARTVTSRKRTYAGKVQEIATAVRIELALSKNEILEAYVNLVDFAPSVRGAQTASMYYFDKPTSALSFAEAASLATMPKGPSVYNPHKSPKLLIARRDYVLDRMRQRGIINQEQLARAKREPLKVHTATASWNAPHFVRDILQGRIHPGMGLEANRVSEIKTTIDGQLQREVQAVCRSIVASLKQRNVTAAAAVVLDNQTGHVLSWVGSHDFRDIAGQGQNDGVLALRQPGSTLKPFVYATAMVEMDWTAATVLPDIDLKLQGEGGTYRPRNYDGLFHGPVKLREALANSYNIPAVYTASVAGPSRVLAMLHQARFDSLKQNASHYGAAIALGDGEVTLIELVQAYAMLARGGNLIEYRGVLSAKDKRGKQFMVPPGKTTSVLPMPIARLLTDILSDSHARQASFGLNSPLQFPFAVAAKTGTSKGFRDNYAVGYTPRVTVGVWVGNFDGSPMQGVSGISGAGPLFHKVMSAANRRLPSTEFETADEEFDRVQVCALSGQLPTDACEHRQSELFIKGTAPQLSCQMHREVEVDVRNGLLAGPGCADRFRQTRRVEVFSPRYHLWAASARRPTIPVRYSPNCPGTKLLSLEGVELMKSIETDATSTATSRMITIQYPYDGAVFLDDVSIPAQAIVVEVRAPIEVEQVRLYENDIEIAMLKRPFKLRLVLKKGRHRLQARAGKLVSQPVSFEVR